MKSKRKKKLKCVGWVWWRRNGFGRFWYIDWRVSLEGHKKVARTRKELIARVCHWHVDQYAYSVRRKMGDAIAKKLWVEE